MSPGSALDRLRHVVLVTIGGVVGGLEPGGKKADVGVVRGD